LGKTVMGVRFLEDLIIEDLKGRRFLVTHGDRFVSPVMKMKNKKLQFYGEQLYVGLMALNNAAENICSRVFNRKVSPITQIRRVADKILPLVASFESAAIGIARKEGFDGIICGHIHWPNLYRAKNGVIYGNTGDWVENCTAL